MERLFRIFPVAAFLVMGTAGKAEPVVLAGEVSLDSLEQFLPTDGNWADAQRLTGDPRRESALQAVPGRGILVNRPTREVRQHLFTPWHHGDVVVELEFLLPPKSNSGIYLMGRYEVQLFDSWRVKEPKFGDCGGLYQRWDKDRGAGQEGYEGTSPLANACRAPGLWQRLRIEFRAPRFDEEGKKIAPARFDKVELNGFVIHENVAVTGPTRAAAWPDEVAVGPLMIQGDHGSLALRGIRCRPLGAPVRKRAANVPVLDLEPEGRILVQRGFVPFLPYKRLYACSVGTPEGIHYAYDFESGALLRLWRGRFLDTADMWHGRGRHQLAQAAGPALTLNAKPTIALIERLGVDDWPDQPSALYASEGYALEPDGRPVFLASLVGLKITDQFAPALEGGALSRTLRVTGKLPEWPAFVLLAEAPVMVEQAPGEFIVGDRQWYLDWPAESPHRPALRAEGERRQLVLPLTKETLVEPITYTIVW